MGHWLQDSTSRWNLPVSGGKGYIEDASSGKVLSLVGDGIGPNIMVMLQEKTTPVSDSQMWIRGMEVGGYFAIVNPTSQKMLYADNPSLTRVIGNCWSKNRLILLLNMSCIFHLQIPYQMPHLHVLETQI